MPSSASQVDEQTLTKHADIAMYQTKTEGKNNYQFYSEIPAPSCAKIMETKSACPSLECTAPTVPHPLSETRLSAVS